MDTKIKSIQEDPDKKWITTWNDYLSDIKYLIRWLHNWRVKKTTRKPRTFRNTGLELVNKILKKEKIKQGEIFDCRAK